RPLRVESPPIEVAQRLARGDASGPEQRGLLRHNRHDLICQLFGLNSQDLRLARWESSTHARPTCRWQTLETRACYDEDRIRLMRALEARVRQSQPLHARRMGMFRITTVPRLRGYL